MNINWIYVVICVSVLVSLCFAERDEFDDGGSRKIREWRGKSKTHGCDDSKHMRERSTEDDASEEKTRRAPEKLNTKTKKYDGETSKNHPKWKKDDGEASARNKRDTSLLNVEDFEMPPHPRTTKIKKKELLVMDQENTGPDGDMMPPFERESDIEELLARTLSTSTSKEALKLIRKGKTIKKYNKLEELKKRKIFEKEKLDDSMKVGAAFEDEKPGLDGE